MKQKTIVGVLGGYGPYATNEFFKLVIESTPAEKDWDHLHVIIDSNPRIPSRARAFLFNEESPVEYMLEGIERLKKAQVDFFVCPCNTAHYFLRKIKEQFDLQFVDMVEIVVDEIEKQGVKSLGVLGTEVIAQGRVYDDLLEEKGIKPIHINDITTAREIIECGKQNRNMEKGRKLLRGLILELEEKGAEGVLYGCTEFPLVLSPSAVKGSPVFDTSRILAEKVVRLAK